MIIDTHCHLYDEKFTDSQEIINNLTKNNVEKVIVCGVDYVSSLASLQMANKNENVFCTLGVHPENADALTEKMEKFMRENVGSKKVVAIGEIGLDYFNEFF